MYVWYSGNLSVHAVKDRSRKCRWEVFKRNQRKNVPAESHRQLQSRELDRIKWPHLTRPSAVLPSQQTMDLSIFWLELITLHSTILLLIFEGKMVDLSPVSDHLYGAVLVRLTTTKPREHDLTLSVPCSQENLYCGAREKNLVATSITV